MEILIKKLSEQAKLPVYSNEAEPGMDLYTKGEVTVGPNERKMVYTGIAMAIPVGYVGLIWNQASMVTNEAVKVTTSLVDTGYRKEITVELTNEGSEVRTFATGEKVAQLLVQKVHHTSLIEADDLDDFEQES